MGLFLVWCHGLICIVLSLCEHACKEVCDIKQGIDPYPLLARSCDRWWPDFITFTACKRSIFELKRAKRRNAFQTGGKIYLSEKIFWGYGHFNLITSFGMDAFWDGGSLIAELPSLEAWEDCEIIKWVHTQENWSGLRKTVVLFKDMSLEWHLTIMHSEILHTSI